MQHATENESELRKGNKFAEPVGMQSKRWYTEIRLLIFRCAPWLNAEKCESRGCGFIHQKSDEWNIYVVSNWNRLTLQNNFPEGGSKSFYD